MMFSSVSNLQCETDIQSHISSGICVIAINKCLFSINVNYCLRYSYTCWILITKNHIFEKKSLSRGKQKSLHHNYYVCRGKFVSSIILYWFYVINKHFINKKDTFSALLQHSSITETAFYGIELCYLTFVLCMNFIKIHKTTER